MNIPCRMLLYSAETSERQNLIAKNLWNLSIST